MKQVLKTSLIEGDIFAEHISLHGRVAYKVLKICERTHKLQNRNTDKISYKAKDNPEYVILLRNEPIKS